MNGILIVDKPEGLTSAEVVRRVKGHSRVKVGHLGTLDPFATGVLPLCIGEGTKIAQFLSSAEKSYEGTIRLGSSTDSGDKTGAVVRRLPLPAVEDAMLRAAEASFRGEYEQKPPMYSALKHNGVPLYKFARRGIEVPRQVRRVRIAELLLKRLDHERLGFLVTCSKGTYVRVLAEDIGVCLGTTGHLESLRRPRFGPFDLSQAVPIAPLESFAQGELMSMREALAHLPARVLNARSAEAARKGQGWVLEEMAPQVEGDVAILLDPDGEVAAIIVRQGARWRFGRVLRALS